MNIAQVKRKRRIFYLISGTIAFSISMVLVLLASRDSLVYFYSPSELLEIDFSEKKIIRIGGLVKKGSIKKKDNLKINFIVEDGNSEVLVEYRGILPDLFREGQGVICEGEIAKNYIFYANKILAKHDEKYMPPEVAKALKETGHWKEGDSY